MRMFHKIALLKYDYSKHKTIAHLEDGNVLLLEEKPMDLIERWCIHNGSTASGRMKAFNILTESIQKPAVLINERSRIVFFPTLSKNDKDCVWINDQKILQTKTIDALHTEITFITGYKTIVDSNRRTIENQIRRCKKFLSCIE